MPDADRRSPLDLALARFRHKRGARYGLWLLLVFVIIAIYAPFLCSETALVWWDDSGLSFPVVSDFFNAKRFGHLHDLFFNLAGLLLPVWFLAWIPLRRRVRAWQWGGCGGIVVILAGIICLLPLLPPVVQHAGRRALWRDRREDANTLRDYRHLDAMHRRLAQHHGDRTAGLQVQDLVRQADGSLLQILEVTPDTEPVSLYVIPVGGGKGRSVNLTEVTIPTQPVACFAPIPHNANSNYMNHTYARPGTRNLETGSRYWLGADATGRDVLARMIYGARISLTVGLYATAISMFIGIIVGAVSGFFGGWVDILLQRVVEIVMTLPSFIIVLIVVATFGRNIFVIMTVIGLVGWTGTARLVRGEFLQQSEAEYVLAGKALGLSESRIMFRHILPNAMTPLLISATFAIAGAVLTEAGLAFVGLGDEGVPSWGGILAAGREIPKYAWMIYTPGIAIFLLVSALNLIGNGLREALDPKHAE